MLTKITLAALSGYSLYKVNTNHTTNVGIHVLYVHVGKLHYQRDFSYFQNETYINLVKPTLYMYRLA